MSVLHKNLTGADLHEPKGVAGATAGQAYVANGSGSGVWQAASTTLKGPVELATNAETTAGTDTIRVVTPSSLKAMLAESPEYTITSAATGLWTHGLGAPALQMQAWLRCTTAIGGWAVGEEIIVGPCDHTGSGALGVQLSKANATQIRYAIGAGIYIINATNGALLAATSANFKLFIRAKPY